MPYSSVVMKNRVMMSNANRSSRPTSELAAPIQTSPRLTLVFMRPDCEGSFIRRGQPTSSFVFRVLAERVDLVPALLEALAAADVHEVDDEGALDDVGPALLEQHAGRCRRTA